LSATTLLVDPCTDELWANLARRRSSLFSSPPWLRAISNAFEIPIHGQLTSVDGDPIQALAFADINDPSGHRRLSLPFSDFCDPFYEGDAFDWSLVGNNIIDDVVPYAIRLRRTSGSDPGDRLTVAETYAWHEVDLTCSSNATWSGLASAARQSIRKAERAGAAAVVAVGADDVDEFRRLHVRLRREKYGMLAQPPEFFDSICAQFAPDNIAVVSVRSEGTMVGAILLLRWGNVAYYKFNASTREGVALHANDLCMWTAMEYARDVWHCRALDLGLSDLDQPGLLRYKQKYATTTGEIARCVSTTTPAPTDDCSFRSDINAQVAEALADGVPDDVSVALSSKVYRYFC
jgi:Acetyltransferase (GNAT) domain